MLQHIAISEAMTSKYSKTIDPDGLDYEAHQ